TAVFYECLAGHPPFDGDLSQLREQHASGSAPLDGIDEPLQQLIAEGMAPNRAHRPHSANAFVSALTAVAPAYGADWEERGRGQLAAAVPPAAGRGRRVAPVGRPRLLARGAAAPVIVGIAAVVAP